MKKVDELLSLISEEKSEEDLEEVRSIFHKHGVNLPDIFMSRILRDFQDSRLTAPKSYDDILNSCKEGVTAFWKKGVYLLRGTRPPPVNMVQQVRHGRRPMSTPKILHDVFCDEFRKAFGFTARDDSVFCSSSLLTARSYGAAVYAVFPIGKIQWIYHPKVNDLFLNAQEMLGKIKVDGKDEMIATYDFLERFKDRPDVLEKVRERVGEMVKGYRLNEVVPSDFRKMELQGGIEVMVHCERYYIFCVETR